MIWQDAVVGVGGFILALMLLPAFLDSETQVPRYTSIPSAIILSSFAVTFYSLGLTFSFYVYVFSGSMWTLIAVYRPTDTPLKVHMIESKEKIISYASFKK